MPIDHFLRSLAQDWRKQGNWRDSFGRGLRWSDRLAGGQRGRRGNVRAGADNGGIRQIRATATCADFVLPPARIAAELARIARHPHFAIRQLAEPESPPKEGGTGLSDILTVMAETTGVDFSLYRAKTVQRRIMRRLALRNIASIEEYAPQLKQDPPASSESFSGVSARQKSSSNGICVETLCFSRGTSAFNAVRTKE